MHVIYIYVCVCTLCDWLYIMCLPAPTHVIRAWQKAVCHDFRCTYTRLHCSLTQCQSVCTVGVSVWFFYGLSLLITLHSTVWILGRMRVGSVVGMLQRSIRKLLIITVITAAHWAAIRERWVANKYAPNIHIFVVVVVVVVVLKGGLCQYLFRLHYNSVGVLSCRCCCYFYFIVAFCAGTLCEVVSLCLCCTFFLSFATCNELSANSR